MPAIKRSAVYPRLTVYSQENFRGRRRIYRGNLGFADVDTVLTGIESLRFFSLNPGATLVLFDRSSFRDNFVILRGNRSIRELDDILRRGDVESLISTNQRLTAAQVRAIQRKGTLPAGYRLL
ncbi:hypothetical protein R70723_14475 [Paenibacillus sp. FSL R7-0273]|uniref:hypothetical protein n=1 Tax=Paenibacillus sp. FSL R7-0273 TaxID=1536772 RepID=UPI0004F8F3F9|nr:hypothetical protein [Paenibacillus sp. FSL R7-0273]AIQ46949.1 hypothetical protein R70723_14475 [Paenibacillus sp. FSL R7-0273]OMF97292.1 hypothetical protein BK144_01140 [Paenibacillus sp. FSL R7-0273]